MRTLLSFAIVCVALTAACGGAQEAPASAPVTEAPASASGAPLTEAEAAGGSAAEGAPCDYGGADMYTCQTGFTCCYPREGEVELGTCRRACE